MILIRRSTIQMGSPDSEIISAVTDCADEPVQQRCSPEEFSDEAPIHRVTLSSFWLDRQEVTVAEYRRCVALRRCRPAPFHRGARRFDRADFPMSLVRWEDARAYCEFRGAALPTEAQFERAARGVNRRKYPWGQLYNSRVVNHGRLGIDRTDGSDGHRELAPVGSFPAGRTPDGFLDLAGNVTEWVRDRYAPYDAAPATDPTGPPPALGATARVVRGGSYEDAAPWMRGANRSALDPKVRAPWLGFRCAKPVLERPRR